MLCLPMEDRNLAKTNNADFVSLARNDSMGRTIPSFRLVLAEVEEQWRDYRSYLRKNDRKYFDGMLAIPRLYVSACSGAVRPIRIYPIFISVLFHHHLELVSIAKRVGCKGLVLAA